MYSVATHGNLLRHKMAKTFSPTIRLEESTKNDTTKMLQTILSYLKCISYAQAFWVSHHSKLELYKYNCKFRIKGKNEDGLMILHDSPTMLFISL